MTLQYINTGSGANAGNGDSIRAAFTKVNNNFAQIEAGNYVGSSAGGAGYTGSRGYIGYTGSSGAAAAMGYTGSHGDIGYTGYIGSQGEVGYIGSKGEIGYTGSQGEVGYIGSKGEIGYTGSQGIQGEQGLIGPQGEQGPIGNTGTQGIQGSTGTQGIEGPIGLTGEQGPIGNTGTQGIQGSTGTQGIEGPIGLTGEQGLQGSTGTQGPRGFTGEQGVSVTLVGSTSTVGGLPLTGNPGDGWIVTDNGDLWFWSTINAQWEDIGQIVGPQGDPGAEGPQGPQGLVGNTGTQGVQGPIGLEGPEGPVGPTGSQGPVGNTGTQGPQGSIGLEGPQGPIGPQGLIGNTGTQGVQGPIGPQGPIASTGDLVFAGGQYWNPNSTGINLWDGPQIGPFNGELLLDNTGVKVFTNNETHSWQFDNLGHFVPGVDILQDIGTPTQRVRHIYVGPGSITVGNSIISESTTGKLLLPGVTRATTMFADEVEEEDDQTHSFGSIPTIIDAYEYSIRAGATPDVAYVAAEYIVAQLDDDGYIDDINVDVSGTWTQDIATTNRNNLMYAYIGADINGTFDANDWLIIPFNVRAKADDIEYEPGASGTQLPSQDGQDGKFLTTDGEDLSWADAPGGASTGDWAFSGNAAYNSNSFDQGLYVSPGGEGDSYIFVPGNSQSADSALQLTNGSSTGRVSVTAYNKQWEFDNRGVLRLPEGGDIVDSSGQSVLGGGGGSSTHIEYTDNETDYTSTVDLTYDFKVDVDNAHLDVNGDGSWSIGSNNFDTKVFSNSSMDNPDNIIVRANDYDWTFGRTGNLTLPEGGDILDSNGDSVLGSGSGATTVARQDTPPATGNGTLWYNTVEGRLYIKYSDAWVDAAPLVMPQPETEFNVNTITFPDASVQTTAFTGNKLFNGDYEVVLDQDGVLNLPRRGAIRNLTGTYDVNIVGAGPNGFAQLQWTTLAGAAEPDPNGTDELKHWLYLEEPGVFIETNLNGTGDSHEWKFGTDGALTLPSGNTRIGNVFGSDAIVGNTDTTVAILVQGQGGSGGVQWVDNIENIGTTSTQVAAVVVNSPLASTSGTVQIVTGASTSTGIGSNFWEFGADGKLTLPGAVVNSTVAKNAVSGPPLYLGDSTWGTALVDGTYGPFTLSDVVFTVQVSSGIVGYNITNVLNNATFTREQTIGTLDSGDLGGTPGTTSNIAVTALVPLALDLTKTVNKLTDGNYALADGVEGQIMYLVRQTGSTYNAITVNVANGRVDGTLYTTIDYYPFENISAVNMSTLIFTDGAWQADNGGWD